jgi:predicted ArsR family transcriptional regulator
VVEGIPADVERFIAETISSVEQLEVLLLLHGTSPQEWTAETVARELRIAAASAARRLANLRARGLLSSSNEPEPTYRFSPREPDDATVVGALAETYATRRVSVITLIFSKPNDAVRLFADAFKIRQEDDDG